MKLCLLIPALAIGPASLQTEVDEPARASHAFSRIATAGKLIRVAATLATVAISMTAGAQQRVQEAPQSGYANLERTMKELLAVTLVPPRTEVVAESSMHGTVTRLTGSLKLAPTFSGRTWGMTAIVVF